MNQITKAYTYCTIGLAWYSVTIEVDTNKSLPTLDIIWLPDAAIKEARERIRMTFKNMGIKFPPQKIVVNLAPSDVRKEGTRFDVAIAVAILCHLHAPEKQTKDLFARSLFFGELGLDGRIKRVTWLLPSVIAARKKWWKHFFVSDENMDELKYIPGITIYPLTNFLQLVNFVHHSEKVAPGISLDFSKLPKNTKMSHRVDFKDIKGHIVPKRALTIAAAGMHNTLLVWPPGSWKTMLAKAMHNVLPPLTFDEIIEVSQLYSIVGKLNADKPLITQRPFRVVHHTASKISIVWWGKYMTPGEISLAHLGILFFDELAEFPREVLEVLRQPLEDKTITISRAHGSASYPAGFMFVATMNPCKCGYYKDPQKQCICSSHDIVRYQSKISGPLLDRFDMVLEVPRENIDTILDKASTQSSDHITELVQASRERQQQRYHTTLFSTNAQLDVKALHQFIQLGEKEETFLKHAIKQLDLSPRVMHRIIKLSRTIADVEWDNDIAIPHIAEALQYRAKGMFVGG